jgi:catechol 2,3-dioxygenase-like lactoylglutathione lyase family enzyme
MHGQERLPMGEDSRDGSASQTPVRVKKLGHVVLRVGDVERSTRFWTEMLGFAVSDRNEQGMVFLRHGNDHHTIALAPARERIPLPDKGRGELGFDHLALEVENVSQLLTIREFLQSRGVSVIFEGRRGPGSNPGVEFLDPDGYMIELYASMDQIGPDGQSRPPEEWRRATSLEDAIEHPVAGVTYR